MSGSARDAKLPLALVDAPGIATTLVGDRSIAFAATLRISPATKDLGNVRLVGDGLDVYGHYRSDSTSASGAALVSTPSVNVGFDIRKGGVRVHPFANRRWYIDTDI